MHQPALPQRSFFLRFMVPSSAGRRDCVIRGFMIFLTRIPHLVWVGRGSPLLSFNNLLALIGSHYRRAGTNRDASHAVVDRRDFFCVDWMYFLMAVTRGSGTTVGESGLWSAFQMIASPGFT